MGLRTAHALRHSTAAASASPARPQRAPPSRWLLPPALAYTGALWAACCTARSPPPGPRQEGSPAQPCDCRPPLLLPAAAAATCRADRVQTDRGPVSRAPPALGPAPCHSRAHTGRGKPAVISRPAPPHSPRHSPKTDRPTNAAGRVACLAAARRTSRTRPLPVKLPLLLLPARWSHHSYACDNALQTVAASAAATHAANVLLPAARSSQSHTRQRNHARMEASASLCASARLPAAVSAGPWPMRLLV